MKYINFLRLHALLLLCVILYITACESDLITGDDDDQDNDPNLPTIFDPDQALELFVLKNAQKISGSLPAAPDGQLRINVKDTIFVPVGFPIGERLVIRHNGLYDITGFYIGIENSSFYYDVPAVEAEAQDSTDVFYLNLKETDGVDWEGFPLIILPHADGIPWDKFIRIVKIEVLGEDAASITVPTDFPLEQVHWEWIYTVMVDPDDLEGNVLLFEGKGVKKRSTYQTGGCCNDDGTSTTVANDPYCFSKFSDGSPNPRWRTIEVSQFFMWAYDVLYLYDDGTFRQANTSMQIHYLPSQSDFCTGKPKYDFDVYTAVKFGTHDFMPGTDHINFTYEVTDPPVFGKNVHGGELLYSSHDILITFFGGGKKWYSKYQRPTKGVKATELTVDWG